MEFIKTDADCICEVTPSIADIDTGLINRKQELTFEDWKKAVSKLLWKEKIELLWLKCLSALQGRTYQYISSIRSKSRSYAKNK